MKIVRDILKYTVFLLLGVILFWRLYKDVDLKTLKAGLQEINYFWIVVSILLGLLSHVSRAVRWKMLIKPLGYNPKTSNVFLSILILYLTNLIVPRAGEVARCTILSKYEKIPASKLIGTMIVERIADVIAMILLAVVIFAVNIGILKEFFFRHPEFGENFVKLLSVTNIILGLAVVALLVVIFFLLNPFRHSRFREKIFKIKVEFKEGVKSIVKLENKWLFIGHTFFIFLMWLLMLYVVFLAYPPTSHLTIWIAMFTFMMSGLAMLAPVQGGIGPWHFMVIESLFLFGIDKIDGKIFALVAHSSTNLIYLFWGLIAMMLFPVLNRKRQEEAEIRN